MTKTRKKLTDTLGQEFVYGKTDSEQTIETTSTEEIEPAVSLPTNNETKPKEHSVLSRLLASTETKEATIRFTVDMPESMHRRLSMLAARLGKKKVEIVRLLLEEALNEVKQ